jgi:alkyl hydroperoxide reductase subunit AhpC
MSVRLGDEAPNFDAETTEGPINFHTWKGGAWAVLFSHPRDFTPVCTTELGTVASLKRDFENRNTKVIGLSVDPLADHHRWKTTSGCDGPRAELSAHRRSGSPRREPLRHASSERKRHRHRAFGVRHRRRQQGEVDAHVPASTGRNFQELLRVIDSLQLTAEHSVATPADWRQGEDVIIVPAVSDDDARKRFPGFVAQKAVSAGDCSTGAMIEMPRELVDNLARIIFNAVDEARLAPS